MSSGATVCVNRAGTSMTLGSGDEILEFFEMYPAQPGCECSEEVVCYAHAKQLYDESYNQPFHPNQGANLNYPEEYRHYFEQYYASYNVAEAEYAVDPQYVEYTEYAMPAPHGYYLPPDQYYAQEFIPVQPDYYAPVEEIQGQYYSTYTAEYVPAYDEPPPGFEHLSDCRSSEMSSELIEDIEDSSDSDYAGSSAMSGSLLDFIDFDPEFNASNMVKNEKGSSNFRGMRPRKWLVDYAQQQCGSQLTSSSFPFAAKKRNRTDMEDS